MRSQPPLKRSTKTENQSDKSQYAFDEEQSRKDEGVAVQVLRLLLKKLMVTMEPGDTIDNV